MSDAKFQRINTQNKRFAAAVAPWEAARRLLVNAGWYYDAPTEHLQLHSEGEGGPTAGQVAQVVQWLELLMQSRAGALPEGGAPWAQQSQGSGSAASTGASWSFGAGPRWNSGTTWNQPGEWRNSPAPPPPSATASFRMSGRR